MNRKLDILMVEDNLADVDLIRETLPENGPVSFQIESVSRLSEALARLKSKDLDLVLLDLGLPDSQGLETFLRLKEGASDLPVIIVTGNDDQETAIAAVREGAQDYLIKGQTGGGLLSRAVQYAVERKLAEQKFRELVLQWEKTFDSIPASIFLLDTAGRITRCNISTEQLLGKTKEEIIGRSCWEVVHGRSDPIPECPITRLKKTLQRENLIMSVDGQWLQITVDPVLDETGNLSGAVHIVENITQRKQAEEKIQAALQEKEIMLREIHHRVKNNLQVIQSLLNLQAGKIKDPKIQEAFKESRDRIRSMALVHEKLYQSSDLSQINMADYLRNLSTRLFHSYQVNPDQVILKLAVDEVQVGIDLAIPLGLILNELISNTLKYAFPGGREGEVRVESDRVDGGLIRLRVGDNGIGFPQEVDFRKAESMGFQLVRALVEQLEGTIELNREGGTEFQITFPEKR